MSVGKTTRYGGDVVMFLLNKIIKNKKLNYPQNKCWPCPKQPMVLLYMVLDGLAHGFKTICKALLTHVK